MVEFANTGEYDMFIFIPNQHALTAFHDGEAIKKNTINVVKAYLAAGLDASKVHIYNQSDIPGHVQLYWVLSCITNMWFMKRMHVYKASVDQWTQDDISVGTFNYPILMAADIILYDAHLVPVGKDQKQHVEYARDIAGKFNHMFGDTFILPESMIQKEVATVPGIDGRKMSKSYNNYIGMFDDTATILKKVKRIPTWAFAIEDPKDPDACNVYNIFKLFLNKEEDIVLRKRYTDGGLSYKVIKHELAAYISDFLAPIQEAYATISDEQVKNILAAGAKHVEKISEKKIADVYTKVGFSV